MVSPPAVGLLWKQVESGEVPLPHPEITRAMAEASGRYVEALVVEMRRHGQTMHRNGMHYAASLVCPLCARNVPHHTNATDSIGGEAGRHPVRDLHPAEGGGLTECLAAPIWKVLDGEGG